MEMVIQIMLVWFKNCVINLWLSFIVPESFSAETLAPFDSQFRRLVDFHSFHLKTYITKGPK